MVPTIHPMAAQGSTLMVAFLTVIGVDQVSIDPIISVPGHFLPDHHLRRRPLQAFIHDSGADNVRWLDYFHKGGKGLTE